jgi:hypothetical protein
MAARLAEPTVPRPISPSAGIYFTIEVRDWEMPVARNATAECRFLK